VTEARRRRAWRVAALAGVVLAAALAVAFVARPLLEPPQRQTALHAGDRVALRSGLALVVPPAAHGTEDRWRSVAAAVDAGETPDSVTLFKVDGVFGGLVALDSYTTSVIAPPGRLAGFSRDRTVEVRWTGFDPSRFNVWVLTELPGRLRGRLEFAARNVDSARSAMITAEHVWRSLSMSGVDLQGLVAPQAVAASPPTVDLTLPPTICMVA